MCISKFHSKTIGFNDVEPYQIFEQTCSGHESHLLFLLNVIFLAASNSNRMSPKPPQRLDQRAEARGLHY
jgi:hypothetical protein